jgi:hypothetical protein
LIALRSVLLLLTVAAASAAAACPKGKTSKSSSAEGCKGLVLHCKRIYARTEAKAAPPVPVQVGQQQQQQVLRAGRRLLQVLVTVLAEDLWALQANALVVCADECINKSKAIMQGLVVLKAAGCLQRKQVIWMNSMLLLALPCYHSFAAIACHPSVTVLCVLCALRHGCAGQQWRDM